MAGGGWLRVTVAPGGCSPGMGLRGWDGARGPRVWCREPAQGPAEPPGAA